MAVALPQHPATHLRSRILHGVGQLNGTRDGHAIIDHLQQWRRHVDWLA